LSVRVRPWLFSVRVDPRWRFWPSAAPVQPLTACLARRLGRLV